MQLGISKSDGRILIGGSYGGLELSPIPMISPCKFVLNKNDCTEGPKTNFPGTSFLFLEDFFDPKSRIRRGRIYKAHDSQPHRWQLRDGSELDCETYGRTSIWAQYFREQRSPLYVLLGDERRFTVWKLIDLEVIATGEEMVTIKAQKTYGSLPELRESSMPESSVVSIRRYVDQVVDEIHTASADSLIDLCREAASEVLASYTNQPNNDLGKLVALLDKEPHKRRLVHKCAGTINDLHPRRKASEQRRRGLRRLSDEDAELAVKCLGTILVELDWAAW